MIALVLSGSASFAAAMKEAAEEIVGPQPHLHVFGIESKGEAPLENVRENLIRLTKEINDGSGVVIFTDMFGGTPSNIAISAMEPGVVEVICGANLPMLIKACTLAESTGLD